MAGLSEQATWSSEIYQLETTDPVLGGPEGPSNLPHRLLANRTAWLRSRLEASCLELSTPQGSQMVAIPPFRVPAGAIAPGVPSQDLFLGGFALDKFPNCIDENVAKSLPFRVPEVVQDVATALDAIALRGNHEHLMTIREWGHLAWLVRLLGHELHGNCAGGKDPRDPAVWESFPVVVGDLGLTGTGPGSWFHNGLRSGVADLLGGRPHLVDGLYEYGTIVVTDPAALVQSIDEDDQDFVVEDLAPAHPLLPRFRRWPTSDGLIVLQNDPYIEYVRYQALVPLEGQPNRATLVGCTRGAYWSTAKAWLANTVLRCERRHCILPGGWTALVSGNGLNNTNSPATFDVNWWLYHHGQHAVPAPGQILACGTEDLLVLSVQGNSLTVERGANGTTVSAHPNATPVVCYPSQGTRYYQGHVGGWSAGEVMGGLDLEELYLPAEWLQDPGTPPPGAIDHIAIQLNGLGLPFMRGVVSRAYGGPAGIGGLRVMAIPQGGALFRAGANPFSPPLPTP